MKTTCKDYSDSYPYARDDGSSSSVWKWAAGAFDDNSGPSITQNTNIGIGTRRSDALRMLRVLITSALIYTLAFVLYLLVGGQVQAYFRSIRPPNEALMPSFTGTDFGDSTDTFGPADTLTTTDDGHTRHSDLVVSGLILAVFILLLLFVEVIFGQSMVHVDDRNRVWAARSSYMRNGEAALWRMRAVCRRFTRWLRSTVRGKAHKMAVQEGAPCMTELRRKAYLTYILAATDAHTFSSMDAVIDDDGLSEPCVLDILEAIDAYRENARHSSTVASSPIHQEKSRQDKLAQMKLVRLCTGRTMYVAFVETQSS